jgi:hypothetical protein
MEGPDFIFTKAHQPQYVVIGITGLKANGNRIDWLLSRQGNFTYRRWEMSIILLQF